MVATDPSGYSSVLAVSSGSPVAAANTADRVLVEPPRDGVDEVASLPDEARALLGLAIPAAGLQPPGVDVVADLQRPAPGPEARP